MHARSTASCLPDDIVVDCGYVLSVKATSPDVDMVRLVALRYGGESASAPGCLCDMTLTPLQLACSGKAPVSRAVYLSMSIALGEKKSRKRV